MVQVADVAPFQPPALGPPPLHSRVVPFELPPGGLRAVRGRRAVDQERGRLAVEPPPRQPFEDHRPLRSGALGQREVFHPGEVHAGHVEVAGPHQPARRGAPLPVQQLAGRLLRGGGQGVDHVPGRPVAVAAGYLAQMDRSVCHLEAGQRRGPEGAEPTDQDQQQQAQRHDQGDHQRAGSQPHHRLSLRDQRGAAAHAAARRGGPGGRGAGRGGEDRGAQGEDRLHSSKALRRNRCRTDSATVLTTKVITNSVNAARNRMR